MNKKTIKAILDNKITAPIHNARYCMVSEEGLECVIKAETMLDSPGMYRAMEMRCHANEGRDLRIIKIELADDLQGTDEEEFVMLKDYFKTEAIIRAKDKYENLRKKLQND